MRNNQSGGKGGKGYYIALILCAAAIGITSYVTRSTRKPEPEQPALLEQAASTEQSQAAQAASTDSQAVEALATDPPASKPAKTPGMTQPSTPAETQPSRLKTAAPLPGSVTTLYAMEYLSYNETTRDWRVHNGVDYAGAEGEPVSAAADGTVVSVTDDDLMGTTVVLRHQGGYETTYAGLEANPCVAPGDAVKLGQTIGAVGTTALAESALGPHIHFSVSYQDMPMNPQDFLDMD